MADLAGVQLKILVQLEGKGRAVEPLATLDVPIKSGAISRDGAGNVIGIGVTVDWAGLAERLLGLADEIAGYMKAELEGKTPG